MIRQCTSISTHAVQNWKQLDFFSGRQAIENRDESFKAVQPRQSQRKLQILEALEQAGARGLTRFELSQALGIQQSSVCNATLQLIFSGEVVETSCRRESQAGGAGLVLILSKYREGF